MTEAEKLFNRIVMRCFERWGFILSFRDTSRHGKEEARRNIEARHAAFVQEILNGPTYDQILIDKEAFFRDNPPEALSQNMTQAALAQSQMATDAASIVFAHSVLDGAAADYCRVTGLVAPQDWESVIDQRQVKLSDTRGSSYEALLRRKLDEFFDQLERESLLKKTDYLLGRCRPPEKWSPITNYGFDRDRLERLDSYRHEVIHGGGLGKGIADAEGEVEYLMKTSLFLMGLVNLRYGLRLDPYYAFTGRDLQQDMKQLEAARAEPLNIAQEEKPRGGG